MMTRVGGFASDRVGFTGGFGFGGTDLAPYRPHDAEEEQVEQCKQAQLQQAEQVLGQSGVLRRLVPQRGAADGDEVAVLQGLVTDRDAVHTGAVGALKVGDVMATVDESDLGVATADIAVVHRDFALGEPADDRRRAPMVDTACRRAVTTMPFAGMAAAVEQSSASHAKRPGGCWGRR